MTILMGECSECRETFRLDTKTLTITMTVPSNGKRGKGHVPAHEVTATEVGFSFDEALIQWSCPICGYADSEYADDAVRKELT